MNKLFSKSDDLRTKAHALIPAGAHTYTKGDDQFPQLSPGFISRGKGARVWDVDGNEFVDWGMGLTSGVLGHAYPPLLEVIKKELDEGCNFIRPSYLEAELAELLVEQIPSAEMVKFAKNGSDVTTAAVKLARAYTGNFIILRCIDQPFMSVHDWFMGDTVVDSGIPNSTKSLTKHFKYNDIVDLKRVIDENKNQGIACVIMEPAATEPPLNFYLQNVKDLCEINNIILIFDEVVTGFRFHPKGAQYLYGVTPHISTFGKAMANGFSISALVGKKEIMELGGIHHKKERVFLLSTTYGGETHHLRAAQKTIEILNQNNFEVTKHIWETGRRIKKYFNELCSKLEIHEFVRIEGIDCRPNFVFLTKEGVSDFTLRTLFLQEMIKHGVLMQLVVPSFSHGVSEVNQTLEGFEKSLKVLRYAITENRVSELLVGNPIKPVFRKFN